MGQLAQILEDWDNLPAWGRHADETISAYNLTTLPKVGRFTHMPPATVLTSSEARHRLGLSRSTFNRRVLAGQIKYDRKLSGTAGYLFDAVYIDGLRTEPAAKTAA